MSETETINVIGGGLAGVEAAWQAAEMGAKVRLYEMRPVQQTPAHRTDQLAEIVCSNSLKTDEPGSAPYLLKEELRRGGSMVLRAAEETKVPAGAALSVDRGKFSELITEWVEAHPNIEIVREEVTEISHDDISIIATGPLTSEALTAEIMKFTGDDQLYFYDAIAPIVAADSRRCLGGPVPPLCQCGKPSVSGALGSWRLWRKCNDCPSAKLTQCGS